MSSTSQKKPFSFNVTLAITIILLAFLILFRGAISQLISGGDCLNMEFFGTKINTCQEGAAKNALISEQEEIITFVQSLKSTIDSLDAANNSLQAEVVSLESKLANDGTGAGMSMSNGSVLSSKQQLMYEKYSASGVSTQQE